MKRLVVFALIALILGIAGKAEATAGSCTVTTPVVKLSGQVAEVSWACTADSSAGTFPATYASPKVTGWVFAVDTTPGGTTPTASTGFTLISSESSVDIMGGNASAMLGTAAARAVPAKSGWINGTITLTTTGSYGAGAIFTVRALIWIQKD